MPPLIDLTGQRFGRWTVIEKAVKKPNNQRFCRCDCGKERFVKGVQLTSGRSKSCGCLKTQMLTKDLTGQRFGRLKALKIIGKNKHHSNIWECLCDCGEISNVISHNLISGSTKSCSCLQRESARELARDLNPGGTNGTRRRLPGVSINEYRRWKVAILSDSYIRKQICTKSPVLREKDIPLELIELKRAQLKIKRELRRVAA